MKNPILILGLFIGCIVIASCTKEKTDIVTVTKIDTINYTDTVNNIDTVTHITFDINVKDSTVQLLSDTISALLDGSQYLLTNYSGLTIFTTAGWHNNPIKPVHSFTIQAQDSLSNTDGNDIDVVIYTTDNYLVANKTYGTIGDTTSIVTIIYFNDTYGINVFGSRFGDAYTQSSYSQDPSIATIKSISSNEINGTFHGTIFYNNDSTSSNKKVVTNGKFNALF